MLRKGRHSYNPSRQDAHEEEISPVPATLNTQMFTGGTEAAMHVRTQQRLHPLLWGVNLAPENVIISDGRPQGRQIYGRSRGSAESDWNESGAMLVTSPLSGGNVLRISSPGVRMIDA